MNEDATHDAPSTPARGPRFSLAQMAIGVAVLCVLLALLAALINAVGVAREAARCSSCHGHMAQLSLAMHLYHDRFGCFPPAYTTDAEGNRLHSWRVLLLPYLEHSPLFDRVDLDKPWNSPQNAALQKEVKRIFRCPSRPAKADKGFTDYVVIVGPETAFPDDKCVSLEKIGDDADKTIMIVELANSDIRWAEPRDVTLEEALGGLSSYHPSGVTAGSVSGRYLNVKRQQPRGVFTINGGEDVSPLMAR